MRFAPEKARLTMQDRNVDIQEGTRFRSVRRRLTFQDDDNDSELNSAVEDNYANSLAEEARQHREKAKERWNFDFVKEVPLPGRYKWVKIEDSAKMCDSTTTGSNAENSDDAQDEEMEEATDKSEDTRNGKDDA